MKFSEREGYVKKQIQFEQLDQETRSRLWNVITIFIQDSYSDRKKAYRIIWGKWMKRPIDEIPKTYGTRRYATLSSNIDKEYEEKLDEVHWKIRDFFLSCEWFKVFDLLEILTESKADTVTNFISNCNGIFEEENASYRFMKNQIVPITDKLVLSEIEKALDLEEENTREHIKQALLLMSNRENSDFRNSMKESISAVEAYCKFLVGDEKTTLGNALKVFEKKTGIKLHADLLTAFTNLYHYSSDAEGIRHSLKDKPKVNRFDAEYFLAVCSAFINYLRGKVSEV